MARPRFCLAVISFSLVLSCRPTSALDIHAYQLRRVKLTPSESQRREHRRVWLNVLQFAGTDSRIKLSHSMQFKWGDEDIQAGFDPQSLKITWLDPEHLLHLAWTTLPDPGSGAYRWDGHVVLLLEGTNLAELFRDTFQAYAKAGLGNYDSTNLQISFEQSGILTLTETDEGSSWEPSATQRPSEWKRTTVWQYRLRERGMVFVRGDQYAAFGRKCALTKVAQMVRQPLGTLQRLNPNYTDSAPCTVRVRDQVDPYHPSMEDGVVPSP